MYKTFHEIIARAKEGKCTRICVAAAEDGEILKALEETGKMGLTKGILVGRKEKIKELLEENQLSESFEIIDAVSDEKAVEKAVVLTRSERADVLMKGLVNSSIFMKKVLDKENGLRTDRIISHMACYEIPGYEKLLFCTDSGINVAPNLERKIAILKNALGALSKMGYQQPKVALLAANEMVDPKVAATRDAADIMGIYQNGVFENCIMEGPLAFDVIFSAEAAKHKGIKCEISGQVDLLLCPSIEVGNALGKSWLHFNNARWAGLVLGGTKPILMGSRSDTFEVKVNGIALACLMNSLTGEYKSIE
ncbi:phosphate butyryltransferase [Clostridium sp. PL3]|uniref:Phosphate butyryltransferase n=1 Tax=Clostridium thailandense TaxID=2794346 RepID=A0A949TK64_9CLOT|nr:phosphate acyltransferase [Clostridium thailandense]MBV7274344.1 phosphate butyryltransferase [Clostridium thailandense]